MPNGIVPDEGLVQECTTLVDNQFTQFAAWQLLLWVNDYTPDHTTTLADLTEASFAGYSRRALPAANWTTPVVSGVYATTTNGTTPQVYTNGGGSSVTVFGVAFLDPTTGTLRLVQRLDTPDITAVDPGGTIAVTPRFSYRSQLASE